MIIPSAQPILHLRIPVQCEHFSGDSGIGVHDPGITVHVEPESCSTHGTCNPVVARVLFGRRPPWRKTGSGRTMHNRPHSCHNGKPECALCDLTPFTLSGQDGIYRFAHRRGQAGSDKLRRSVRATIAFGRFCTYRTRSNGSAVACGDNQGV